jgi:hypothetical protein
VWVAVGEGGRLPYVPRDRDHRHLAIGGALDHAAHESSRTTKLCDRTGNEIHA